MSGRDILTDAFPLKRLSRYPPTGCACSLHRFPSKKSHRLLKLDLLVFSKLMRPLLLATKRTGAVVAVTEGVRPPCLILYQKTQQNDNTHQHAHAKRYPFNPVRRHAVDNGLHFFRFLAYVVFFVLFFCLIFRYCCFGRSEGWVCLVRFYCIR